MTKSPDAAARIEQAFTDVTDQLRRADTKAASLLPLFGGFLAGVVALSTRSMPVVSVVLLWLSAMPMVLAVLLLLNAVRPRFDDNAAFGFPRLVRFTGRPSELLSELAEESPLTAQAVEVSTLANIVRAKYRRVRTAVDLLVLGLLTLAVSLTVMAVA
jgi:hypothetical protein